MDTLFAVAFKGGEQLEPVRAELYNDRLVIYRHDLVYEDVLAHNVSMFLVPTEPSPAFHSIQCVIWCCRKLGSDSRDYAYMNPIKIQWIPTMMQDIVNERVVTLVRGEYGIGVSIQGGIDFKCPVKIYKIFENSPGE